jgi:hypothetical protein
MLKPVNVVVPQLQITIRRMDGSTAKPFSQIQYYVKERDSAYQCTATLETTSATGVSVPTNSLSYQFTLPLPFGNYEVCVATRETSSTSNWRKKVTASSGTPAHRNLTTTALAIANGALPIDTPYSSSAEGRCVT